MRSEESWAKAVSHLTVDEVPEGAVNLNVAGRRLTSPIQGFGKMWQKTYRVRIPSDRVSPTELISTWKEHFPELQSPQSRFFPSMRASRPGRCCSSAPPWVECRCTQVSG